MQKKATELNKKLSKAIGELSEMNSATRKEACKNFPLFMAYYFPQYIKNSFAYFHWEMFDDVKRLTQSELREIAWFMFRESAKTSISKIFVTYLICYELRHYINVDSFSKSNAEQILFDVVLNLQTNKKLKKDFGEIYNSKRDTETAQRKRISDFITNNGIRVEAHSTQESVRGRLYKQYRPDFLLLDDFETSKTVASKAYTEQVINHIKEFQTGLAGDAWVVYLGNYISEYGSVQELINRSKEDKGLNVRMVAVIEGDEPVWPSKYAMTDEEASKTGKISLEDKKRQLGSVTFNMEMMNQPVDEENAKFKKHMFIPVKWDEVKSKRTSNFITIDTAMSEGAASDNTGITRNYVTMDNTWHVKSYAVRVSPKQLIDLLFKLHEEDNPDAIGIEETMYSKVIKPFIEDEMRRRNRFFTITPLKHGGKAKEARILSLLARYEAKTIKHIEGWCQDVEDELVVFPKGVHDDVADSLAYQFQVAEAPYQEDWSDDWEEERPVYADLGI